MKKVVELKKVEWEEEDGKTTRVLECFWRCVTDLSACWKLYDFAGFNQHQNCPFCDVEDTKQRSDLDLIWGTWDWKEAGGKKEKLKNLMGMSLKLYCVCSLHMMMRVVNYLVSWLYGVFGEGCQERKFKKFFERIGVGWTAYEDLETGKRRFKSYGGAECKKILEHSRELDGMLKKYEDEIKQWKIGEEKKKEKPKKKKLGKKGNKGKGKGKGKEKGKGKGGKKEKEKEKEKEKRKEEKNEEVIDRAERGGGMKARRAQKGQETRKQNMKQERRNKKEKEEEEEEKKKTLNQEREQRLLKRQTSAVTRKDKEEEEEEEEREKEKEKEKEKEEEEEKEKEKECGWRGYEREEKEGEREVDNLSTCGCVIQLYLWENTQFIEIREFGWGFLMLTS